MFSNHYYNGYSDISHMNTDAAYISSYGKVMFNGEFGLTETSTIESFYKATISNSAISGSLIWSLR